MSSGLYTLDAMTWCTGVVEMRCDEVDQAENMTVRQLYATEI